MATITSPAPLTGDASASASASAPAALRFLDRHLGPDAPAQAHMLTGLGYASLDALMASAVPAAIRCAPVRGIPPARAEHEALA